MNTQVMAVGSAKANGGRRRPRIRLAGFWLESFGFTPDSLVSAVYSHGGIVLQLQGEGLDAYRKIVGQVRTSKSGLLQVKNELHNKKRTPHMEVKGFWLEEMGFTIGSILVVRSEYGLIRINLIDPGKLGF
jgi:hypothetical protein